MTGKPRPTQESNLFEKEFLYCSVYCSGHELRIVTVQTYKMYTIRYYVVTKCQLDATDVFIADLIACSTCFGHHYAHH